MGEAIAVDGLARRVDGLETDAAEGHLTGAGILGGERRRRTRLQRQAGDLVSGDQIRPAEIKPFGPDGVAVDGSGHEAVVGLGEGPRERDRAHDGCGGVDQAVARPEHGRAISGVILLEVMSQRSDDIRGRVGAPEQPAAAGGLEGPAVVGESADDEVERARARGRVGAGGG